MSCAKITDQVFPILLKQFELEKQVCYNYSAEYLLVSKPWFLFLFFSYFSDKQSKGSTGCFAWLSSGFKGFPRQR